MTEFNIEEPVEGPRLPELESPGRDGGTGGCGREREGGLGGLPVGRDGVPLLLYIPDPERPTDGVVGCVWDTLVADGAVEEEEEDVFNGGREGAWGG